MSVTPEMYAALGGEKMLREQYPTVHQMLSQAQLLAPRGSEQRQKLWAESGITALNVCVCVEEKAEAAQALGSGEETLKVFLRSNLTQESEVLLYTVTIQDENQTMVLDSMTGSTNNVLDFETVLTSSSALVRSHITSPLVVIVNYTWIENGKAKSERIIEKYSGQGDTGSAVSNITVTDPVTKEENEAILVTYSRVDSAADYSYTGVVFGDNVKIKFPFKGSIEVAENYTIDEVVAVDPTLTSVVSELYFSVEGTVNASYYGGSEDALLSLYTISDDKKSVSWALPDGDDWGIWFDKASFSAKSNAYFYSNIILKVTYHASAEIYRYISVLIYSLPKTDALVDDSDCSKGIKPLLLYWGCFAENTPILMADNTTKFIQDIAEGEQVKTDCGTAKVCSTAQGLEERLIHIETQNGCALRVTDTHPIMTNRGLLPAKELTAADLIVTLEGESQLTRLHYEPYGATVYNLTLEPHGLLVAGGGIYAGDTVAQNTASNVCEQKPETALQKELAQLLSQLA